MTHSTVTSAMAAAVLGLSAAASAKESLPAEPRAQVMVLGVFHFDNPGQDLFNLQVDDVLQPARQAQIAALVAELKRFKPTKIAVEARLGDPALAQHYAGYLAGTYSLTRSEVDQLGLRLAKELGHPRIYGVDVPGDLPFENVMAWAEKHGRKEMLDETMGAVPAMLKPVADALASGSISSALQLVNADDAVLRGEALYLSLARFAGGGEYPGPDLLAEWYRRNARIHANVRALVDGPQERVLVIYGSGHLHWLQRNVVESGDLALVPVRFPAGAKQASAK